MYAIIETGGKQYKVNEGDVVFVEKLLNEEGSSVTFDKVVAVSKDGNASFGDPFIANATVTGKVLGHGKDKKLLFSNISPKKDTEKSKVIDSLIQKYKLKR